MITSVDQARELLTALARQHGAGLPVRASSCLSAAVDELTDPLVPPAPVPVPDQLTAQLTAQLGEPVVVVSTVRGWLTAAAGTAPTVTAALAYGRAARELRDALDILHSTSRPTTSSSGSSSGTSSGTSSEIPSGSPSGPGQ